MFGFEIVEFPPFLAVPGDPLGLAVDTPPAPTVIV
jgi:hypothetical protein